MYYSRSTSPIGPIRLLASDRGLSALYFEPQKDEMERRFPRAARQSGHGNPWLLRAEAFLSCYFAGDLDFSPELEFDLQGTTFQLSVWKALETILPGETRTYSQIAQQIGRPRASRAVGAAVGHNPLSILIPCHRVVGSTGALTGYAGGLDRKRFLLRHEAACRVAA